MSGAITIFDGRKPLLTGQAGVFVQLTIQEEVELTGHVISLTRH